MSRNDALLILLKDRVLTRLSNRSIVPSLTGASDLSRFNSKNIETMPAIKLIALILVGVVFLLFGIVLLISSYQLNDPFSFIMSFFAANFVILISASLLIGFVWHLVRYIKLKRRQ